MRMLVGWLKLVVLPLVIQNYVVAAAENTDTFSVIAQPKRLHASSVTNQGMWHLGVDILWHKKCKNSVDSQKVICARSKQRHAPSPAKTRRLSLPQRT